MAAEYEKCNGCREAAEKYITARNKADTVIADLIKKGVLSDAELSLIQANASGRVSAIRSSGYGNMVANAEVKAQADVSDFILQARMQRDGVKLTPTQQIGSVLMQGGFGDSAKGTGKSIGKATQTKPTNNAKPIKKEQSSETASENKPLDAEYFRQQYGAENVHQGGGNRLETRERVNRNVTDTATGSQRSKFDGYVQKEKERKTGLDFNHFIGGDTNNRSGKVTGGHSLARGDVRVIQQTSIPDKNGVYQATVEIRTSSGKWEIKTNKNGKPMRNHSMFPANWDEAKIRSEVTSAWENRKMIGNSKWEGQSKSGVWIEGFTTPRGTAYPIYGK